MGAITSTTHQDPAPLDTRLPGRVTGLTWAVVAVAVVGRLPFLMSSASPDEGGYLLLASQWHPGTSLYGDYWLARPPLLIVINGLAVAAGGTPALRVIGILAVLSCVLLAAAIGREVAPREPGGAPTLGQVAPLAVVVIFMTTPLFGNTHVDGELLAAPFVLGGVLAYLRASRAGRGGTAITWMLTAGAAATCAAMVKQNSIDAFVFVGACVVLRLIARDGRAALRGAAVFAAGALGAAVVILGVAMLRGTNPVELWDAVVTFRAQAPSVLGSSAPETNTVRLHQLLMAAAVSLAPIVIAVLGWQSRGRPVPGGGLRHRPLDLRWPAFAMLAWEVVSIAGGGSFWLHYLLDLVPGMTVLALAAAQRPPSSRRVLGAALTAAALSSGISTAGAAIAAPHHSVDWGTISYLRDHARPGDTAAVAFGHPNILWEAHLPSPYEQLWSLPVRIRDHDLTEFSHVLTSPDAPTWVVVSGANLYSWGIDARHGDHVLETDYHRVAVEGSHVIWHVNQ